MPLALPANLTRAQQQALENALRKYAGQVSQKKLQEILAKIKESLVDLNNPRQVDRGTGQTVTEGLNPATARNAIMDILQKNGVEALSDQVNFTVRIASEVMQGAANFVRSNDPDVVEAYPAWEFDRVYDREVPRGFKRGAKGALIRVPDEAWPARWEAACKEAEDDDALEVFNKTGRMVALKDSEVWQALGDGAGGYEDTLGNPYAPFAFNSGYDTDEVSYAECVKLGLLDAGEKPKPAPIDLKNLFAPIEEAA